MNKIIKDIKEALNTDNKTKAYDTQAKVVRSEGQTLWVHIPGGVDETPVKKTINAKAGDTVQVRVSGGSAWLVGNQSAPPTDDTTAIIADRKASEVRGIATLAQELSEKAEQTAISAQVSANGKNTIYYDATEPTGGTYKLGDTWFNSSEDNAIYTWNGSSWVKEELGEDAIANLSITNAKIANGTIQNGKIANLDAGKITAGDLSAAVMQTNAVSAINATANKIDAKNINASQITVGDLSDGSNYSTTAQMNTAIGNAIPRVTYNGVMTSSNGTYAKVATCKAFSLENGAVISLYMSSSELNAAALTLNINSTGAKDIYVGNDAVSATNRLNWLYGCTITFVYDGTHYVVADNPPSYMGGNCTTAESTAQKDTVIDQAVIFKGTTVTVPMTNSNTASTPTLRINNSGGTAITASNVYFGSGSTSPTKANGYAWPAGAAVIFTFDGQYWRFGNQTFIDGGNILTGTISADRIGANSLTIGKLSGSVQTSLAKADYSMRYAKLSQAGTVTNTWFKIASININQTTTQASISFDVSHLYSGTYDPKGKLNVYIRTDSNGYVNISQSKITWTDATEDIKSRLSDFVIAYKPNDMAADVEVWVKVSTAYWTLMFKSLSESFSSYLDYTKWTLYDNSSSDAKSAITTGYSTIASKVDASSQYVTKIDDAGIFISPANQSPTTSAEGNSVKIDGTGMEVFKGSTSVAKYGDTARIGDETAAHSVIDADGQRFYARNGTTLLANIGYASGTSQSGTATAPYYDFGIRESGTTKGNYSVAEGSGVTASGYTSHAEGKQTKASGGMAHAEGNLTFATGFNSHSEGKETSASGDYSHAEGESTTSSGEHAHAEGYFSEAAGICSHAQNRGTKASGEYQTAIGKYNVEDASNNYALIIGNGTGGSARSNALTVDWNGNIRAGVETPTISITTSTGTLNATNIRRFGHVVQLHLQLRTSASTASGGNIYTGTISTTALRPSIFATGVVYYGAYTVTGTITSAGAIVVRNSNPSAIAATGTSNINIVFTYIVA